MTMEYERNQIDKMRLAKRVQGFKVTSAQWALSCKDQNVHLRRGYFTVNAASVTHFHLPL